MASTPPYAPVSPIREFPSQIRSDFDIPHFNGERGVSDSTFGSDGRLHNLSNDDSCNGSSSQPDGQSCSNSPIAGGSTTCGTSSWNRPENSNRTCSPPSPPPLEPWKQQKSHFRPWLASSKSNNNPAGETSSSKRLKPYHILQHHCNSSSKQLQQKDKYDN